MFVFSNKSSKTNDKICYWSMCFLIYRHHPSVLSKTVTQPSIGTVSRWHQTDILHSGNALQLLLWISKAFRGQKRYVILQGSNVDRLLNWALDSWITADAAAIRLSILPSLRTSSPRYLNSFTYTSLLENKYVLGCDNAMVKVCSGDFHHHGMVTIKYHVVKVRGRLWLCFFFLNCWLAVEVNSDLLC